MSDKRSSVMVLPVVGGKVLLQWFKNNGQTIWDGFGSFYLNGNDSKVTAQKVFADTFKESISPENLVERAKLKYYISKPSGLVDLDITIYFANLTTTSLSGKNTKWFNETNVPYNQMHVATGKWLPILMKKPELLKAILRVDQDGDHTKGVVIEFTTQ